MCYNLETCVLRVRGAATAFSLVALCYYGESASNDVRCVAVAANPQPPTVVEQQQSQSSPCDGPLSYLTQRSCSALHVRVRVVDLIVVLCRCLKWSSHSPHYAKKPRKGSKETPRERPSFSAACIFDTAQASFRTSLCLFI